MYLATRETLIRDGSDVEEVEGEAVLIGVGSLVSFLSFALVGLKGTGWLEQPSQNPEIAPFLPPGVDGAQRQERAEQGGKLLRDIRCVISGRA